MKRLHLLPLLALLLCPLSARAADEALLIGVNEYPGLAASAKLRGCVGDAELMEEKLKLYGFHTTVLRDTEATRQGILDAITALRDKVTAQDRVVVFFAGHGTIATGGESVLLPHDARDGDEANDLKTMDLYRAVSALPSKKKTILLDSCHSGGMARSLKGLTDNKGKRARVYLRPKQRAATGKGTKAWQKVTIRAADDLSSVAPGGGVCYFTASLKTQIANETAVAGREVHGLFTFHLASLLDGKRDLWENIVPRVTEKLAEATQGEQKPILFSNDYLKREIFEGLEEATPVAPPVAADASTTLLNLYNQSVPDPAMLSLTMTPEISPLKLGTPIRFKVTVGRDGFLVLIGRDPKNELSVLYPASPDDAAVRIGDVVTLPKGEEEFFAADAAGTDSVKAFLFSTRDAAKQMIDSFNGASQTARKMSRKWATVTVKKQEVFTSEIITLILEKDAQ